MQSKHNKKLVPLAKQLRKEMTKEERHLWYDFLRSYPVNFSRQKILGKYIVHFDEFAMKEDAERTAFLEEYGLKVIRIPNNEINENFYGVCEYIDFEVKQSLSHD